MKRLKGVGVRGSTCTHTQEVAYTHRQCRRSARGCRCVPPPAAAHCGAHTAPVSGGRATAWIETWRSASTGWLWRPCSHLRGERWVRVRGETVESTPMAPGYNNTTTTSTPNQWQPQLASYCPTCPQDARVGRLRAHPDLLLGHLHSGWHRTRSLHVELAVKRSGYGGGGSEYQCSCTQTPAQCTRRRTWSAQISSSQR